jgi:hypothetical protein
VEKNALKPRQPLPGHESHQLGGPLPCPMSIRQGIRCSLARRDVWAFQTPQCYFAPGDTNVFAGPRCTSRMGGRGRLEPTIALPPRQAIAGGWLSDPDPSTPHLPSGQRCLNGSLFTPRTPTPSQRQALPETGKNRGFTEDDPCSSRCCSQILSASSQILRFRRIAVQGQLQAWTWAKDRRCPPRPPLSQSRGLRSDIHPNIYLHLTKTHT